MERESADILFSRAVDKKRVEVGGVGGGGWRGKGERK